MRRGLHIDISLREHGDQQVHHRNGRQEAVDRHHPPMVDPVVGRLYL